MVDINRSESNVVGGCIILLLECTVHLVVWLGRNVVSGSTQVINSYLAPILLESHISILGFLLRVHGTIELVFGICRIKIRWLLENKIFRFRNVPDPSSTPLALRRNVIGIEDFMLRVQRRDRMEAPVDIWHVLFVECDDSMVSSF